MRIALIAPSYESHDFGLGRRVRELAHGVARAGGRMEVLANVSDARRVAAADEGVTVRVVRPPSGSGYPLSRALRAYLREHRASYDLVHAHGYLALPVAAASNGLLGRLVFSPEEREGSRGRIGQLAESSYRQVSRTALAATDLVICSSQIQADSIARQAPALSPRLRVVCDGVDVHSITRARPFLTQRRVILSFGRPGGGGRADRAIAALPDLGDGYELVVAGCSAIRRRLEARAVDLQVADQVRILERASDAVIHGWLRTASVVLALSDDDTSAAIMESACAGVPTIAADMPAHRETAGLINDPALRLVSNRASPLLIADEIVRAVDTAMNPLTALAVPTLQDVADRTVSLYSELLDERTRAAEPDRAGVRTQVLEQAREAGAEPLEDLS